ncbi:MAG TPA: contractile injection system tape measure protein [Puia sp.]|jgi:hypothetical protein|nr:contractile injection system tape measure protein [Puia sp.]
MNHHIQKQQFILTVRQGIDAFAAQHAASRWLRQGLLPVLEKIFDELSGEDEVIRLDHCIIDLGVIPESVLQSGVVDEVMYRQLKQEFKMAIEKELSLRPGAITRAAEGVMQRWWYYMEHGRLPWNADSLGEEDYRRVLELFSVDFVQITRLRNALVEGSTFLTRVVAQHNGRFLENLVTVLVSSRQEGLAESVIRATEAHRILEGVYRLRAAAVGGKHTVAAAFETSQHRDVPESLRRWASQMTTFRQAPVYEQKAIIWRRLLVFAVQHRDRFVRAGGVQVLLQDIPEDLMEILVAAPEFRGGDGSFLQAMGRAAERRREKLDADLRPAGEAPGSPADEKHGPSIYSADEAVSAKQTPAGETSAPENKYGDHGQEEGPAEPRPGEKSSQQGDHVPAQAAKRPMSDEDQFRREQVTEEGIYLSNAGLILLHPFLSTLFNRLHFWDGGGFTSLEARQKAIFLLHFLATDERTAPEYSLVFPKMLCGYTLEMPLPAEMTLSDEECAEALLLLENVVLRWEKLGSTSPQGLREGFLQRRGKLFDKGGRLALLMESSAVDVLLDYLPWNMSLVKLPWLKDILYVEWR